MSTLVIYFGIFEKKSNSTVSPGFFHKGSIWLLSSKAKVQWTMMTLFKNNNLSFWLFLRVMHKSQNHVVDHQTFLKTWTIFNGRWFRSLTSRHQFLFPRLENGTFGDSTNWEFTCFCGVAKESSFIFQLLCFVYFCIMDR